MSNAIKSQGTAAYISQENADTTVYGSATFVAIGEVDDVGEPSGEASDIDITHLLSTAKEFLTGIPDEGTLQLTGNFLSGDAGQLAMELSRTTQEKRWLKVVWSNGTVFYWKATCKKYAPTAKVDGKVPFTATMRLSGARTVA